MSYFSRWHPQVSLRYLLIVNELNKIKGPVDLLEVGSGSLGIAPYLKKEIVGVDDDFSGPTIKYLRPIKTDALVLPFKNNSFDYIVSVDVLEHIAPQNRPKFLAELLRVARKKIFLAVPCGVLAMEQDRQLSEQYKQKFKQVFPFFKDHLDYGLPEENEVVDLWNKAAEKISKKIKIKKQPNLNLGIRRFLMRGWMSKNIFINILFRKVFLVFTPFWRWFNQPPTYRMIFFVEIA